MRFTTLAVALLAHTAALIFAAPVQIEEHAPVEDSALFPRGVTCTNYAGQAAGSTITKRSQINWCRKASTQWLTFPSPGKDVATPAIFNTLFVQAINGMTYQINAGNGATQLPGEGYVTCTNNFYDCLIIEQHGHMTYARAKVAVEILQNYVYVSKHYAAITATAFQFQVNQGAVRIS